WVAWAGRVTVRRLSEDVERALALSETDREAFRDGGGLPPEARDEREIGAPCTETGEPAVAGDDREIGAGPTLPEGPASQGSAPEEPCCARFIGRADVVQLFRAVLCTVRRRMEREEGRLPTPGEALGAMLDHAFSSWGALDGKLAARHKVFARDGWRCEAPGCTSMQNLHDHHIQFRSVGGDDALENRTTLCAFHHLRGVHAGRLRCVGRAPDGLRWEMGIRPGVTPLLAYRSGDLQVSALVRGH
ncbi:MAG: HNH endonuclease, partial [Deltaproteobacteria bacterium]|nr:HNH endonuclease [Deltaproteobacteria bacterium]